MSFTYDPSLRAWRDHARLALGDLDSSEPLLSDETIDAKLATFGFLEGLAQLADSLVALFAQEPDHYSEGSAGLAAQWSGRADAWRQVAADCRSGRVAVPVGASSRGLIAVDELENPDLKGFRAD